MQNAGLDSRLPPSRLGEVGAVASAFYSASREVDSASANLGADVLRTGSGPKSARNGCRGAGPHAVQRLIQIANDVVGMLATDT
jgi:hypothetical protein